MGQKDKGLVKVLSVKLNKRDADLLELISKEVGLNQTDILRDGLNAIAGYIKNTEEGWELKYIKKDDPAQTKEDPFILYKRIKL